MSGPSGDWSSAPAREPGHVDETALGREARPAPDASAPGRADGRVHGTPAPEYGEYAPAGWVNPVLVEQERQAAEQQRQDAAQRRDADERRASDPNRPASDQRAGRRTSGADRPGSASSTPASVPASPYGASRLDFVLTVGLLFIGLWSVFQALSTGTVASTTRAYVTGQFGEMASPADLSSAAVVRAVVLVVVFALVAWWSVRRLRAHRWTFWVPLVGGVVASVLGAVPMLVVVFQDPAVQESIRRMTGG
ncbi:DUF6264 family protein [Curtobacterium caseinilyticum]|uniref:DUF6264 family protein n=1 Tax=Curtobacterium caseinilyticum TaxID=3055137 RepID=A0ABT7TP94_9MICO|nr:DUF6264 family protein [Curtobacterium caseinilyticum]MDM7891169.1 DUF6264 family protein [Curtobacterium caseinilyticum]